MPDEPNQQDPPPGVGEPMMSGARDKDEIEIPVKDDQTVVRYGRAMRRSNAADIAFELRSMLHV